MGRATRSGGGMPRARFGGRDRWRGELPCLLAVLFTATLVMELATSTCYQACNGNGFCDSDNTCVCQAGFTGADCSERTCPEEVPWFETVDIADAAHNQLTKTECASMGQCNRLDGKCGCFDGFRGPACEIMNCPADCNGHGRCMTLSEAAVQQDGISLLHQTTYARWDANRIVGCVCDQYYTGYDCSVRTCITGDDVRYQWTSTKSDEVQVFTCDSTSGTFKFEFRGQTTQAISYNAWPATSSESGSAVGTGTGESLESKLEALTTIDDVTVTSSTSKICDAGTATFSITFTRQHGDLPTLAVVQSSGASATYNSGSSVAGTKQELVCNNRGLCDINTGLCSCYGGFASSDGKGRTSASSTGTAGSVGDCGFQSTAPTNCPGSTPCTDHGECSGADDYRCTCHEGWTSGDCSLRVCPYGLAWFDEPTATDTAHAPAECSNRGVCDRSNGQCTCQKGFTGAACERTDCPLAGDDSLPCNGVGACLTMREAATARHVNGVAAPLTYGSSVGSQSTWDADKIQGCVCLNDMGAENGAEFGLHDCSSRQCPRGDNPYTTHQRDEVQTIFCSATSGSFTLTFRGSTTVAIPYDTPPESYRTLLGTATVTAQSATLSSTSVDFSANGVSANSKIEVVNLASGDARNYTVQSAASSSVTLTESSGMASHTGAKVYLVRDSIKAILEDLNTVGTVNVSLSTGSTICSSAGTYTSIGFQTNAGDLPLMTATSSVSGGTATVSVMERHKGMKERATCAGQGLCNVELGVCNCFPSWRSSDGNGKVGHRGDCGFRDALSAGNVL